MSETTTATPDYAAVAEGLETQADRLAEPGVWGQEFNGICAGRALNDQFGVNVMPVNGREAVLQTALAMLAEYGTIPTPAKMWDVVAWNDYPDTTAEQVVSAFRGAAALAREKATA